MAQRSIPKQNTRRTTKEIPSSLSSCRTITKSRQFLPGKKQEGGIRGIETKRQVALLLHVSVPGHTQTHRLGKTSRSPSSQVGICLNLISLGIIFTVS